MHVCCLALLHLPGIKSANTHTNGPTFPEDGKQNRNTSKKMSLTSAQNDFPLSLAPWERFRPLTLLPDPPSGKENREALERENGVELILDSINRHSIRTSLPF